jgi:hypothetical protein
MWLSEPTSLRLCDLARSEARSSRAGRLVGSYRSRELAQERAATFTRRRPVLHPCGLGSWRLGGPDVRKCCCIFGKRTHRSNWLSGGSNKNTIKRISSSKSSGDKCPGGGQGMRGATAPGSSKRSRIVPARHASLGSMGQPCRRLSLGDYGNARTE